MVNEKGNCYKVFQSTLLQEERLLSRLSSTTLIKISIHAPTRGATIIYPPFKTPFIISIHAPTRGATGHQQLQICLSENFNPRSYKRSDVPCGCCSTIAVQFQSTLLQEERRQKCTIILILICNNYCIVSIKSHQHYNNYFM